MRCEWMLVMCVSLSVPAWGQEHAVAVGVLDFWVVAEGRVLVFIQEDGIYRVSQTEKEACPLFRGAPDVRGWMDERTMALGKGNDLVVLDVLSGAMKTVLANYMAYEVLDCAGGESFRIILAWRDRPEPTWSFHIVFPAAGKARTVLELPADTDVVPRVVDEGRTLVVESDGKGELRTQHRVDLRTFEVTRRVYSGQELPLGVVDGWTCPDGKTRVTVDDGKLWVVAGSERRPLGILVGRFSPAANRRTKPTHVALCGLTDTNGDGRIAREDGDVMQCVVLDLASLRLTLLADANCESVKGHWSDDGRYFIWSVPDPDKQYAYDSRTDQTQPLLTGAARPDITLPDGRLIAADHGSLSLLDMAGRGNVKQQVLVDALPSKWRVFGNSIVYLQGDPDSRLLRRLIPQRE